LDVVPWPEKECPSLISSEARNLGCITLDFELRSQLSTSFYPAAKLHQITEQTIYLHLQLAMASSDNNYEALAKQIESILNDPEGATAKISNETTRRRLVEGGRKLSVALEQNIEILRRIGHAVC
jgi:hypothetical protein